MSQRIAVYNHASMPLGLDLAALVTAMQAYIDTAVGPAWNVSASLHVASDPVAGEWGMVFLDDADSPGALAYHDEESGAPLAKVFVRTIQQNNVSLSVSASHELVEMLVDPLCNLYAPASQPTLLYAVEAADAVEDDSLGFQVGGMLMSDFVYPAWFDPSAAASSKFDHRGVITRPFELHSGGYAITLHGGVVGQTFGSTVKARAFSQEDRRGHRSELRRSRGLEVSHHVQE